MRYLFVIISVSVFLYSQELGLKDVLKLSLSNSDAWHITKLKEQMADKELQKSKSFKQIKDVENSFVVLDDVVIGSKHKIPLWLFGFLY